MVKLNKIYTRTGDEGDSGLVDGSRRPKSDARFNAIGDVDEANSMIGLARLHTSPQLNTSPYRGYDAMLMRIQHDLFDMGADLATPYTQDTGKALRIVDSQVERLEQEIDQLNASIEPLNSFVLPGGTELAARLHLARTVVRRAERMVCALAEQERVNAAAIRYLNRLSDFLFVLARAANNNGKADVLWQPGVNR